MPKAWSVTIEKQGPNNYRAVANETGVQTYASTEEAAIEAIARAQMRHDNLDFPPKIRNVIRKYEE